MCTTIRGYLCHFDDRAQLGRHRFERFRRNSIINNRAPLRVAHAKAPGSTYAWADLSQDQFGYRFECVIPDCANSYGIARLIRDGCDAMSMSFRPIAASRNGLVTVIERARLTEISIVESGAYPSARCWVVGPDLRYAPPAIRALVEAWEEEAPSELTAQQMKAASDTEEVESYPPDNPFIVVKSSERARADNADPVRCAVRRYVYSYLSRGPR